MNNEKLTAGTAQPPMDSSSTGPPPIDGAYTESPSMNRAYTVPPPIDGAYTAPNPSDGVEENDPALPPYAAEPEALPPAVPQHYPPDGPHNYPRGGHLNYQPGGPQNYSAGGLQMYTPGASQTTDGMEENDPALPPYAAEPEALLPAVPQHYPPDGPHNYPRGGHLNYPPGGPQNYSAGGLQMYTPGASQTTVLMAPPVQNTFVMGIQLTHTPAVTACPFCLQTITTRVGYTAGLLTWLICGGIALFGLWLGCCFIPFCVDGCKDVDHYCPNCNHHIYKYKRM